MYELAALAAATCWALNGLIAVIPSRALGAVRFNLIRMSVVSIGLAVYVSYFGGWDTIKFSYAQALILSGLIGVFLGDTAQFLALNRLGPRKTAMLFSLNAPIAAVLGWVFLNESLLMDDILGVVLCGAGVLMAIAYGTNSSNNSDKLEAMQGAVWLALTLGLLAAIFQAIGSLIIRPALAAGADPVASSAIRMGISAVGLLLISKVTFFSRADNPKVTLTNVTLTILSGFLGMGVGMTLIMYALVGAQVGIVSTLSATTPAMMLPLLWLKTGIRPTLPAWIGAVLVIIGCSLIFT